MKQVNRKKTLRANSQILSAEIKHLEQKMWKNNRFCSCGANCLKDCSCSKEKRKRFVKRVKRKRNKELGNKGAKILMAAQQTENFSI